MTEDRAAGRGSTPIGVLHERSGRWARQLRGRLQHASVRWVESRSRADLLAAIAASHSSIVLIEAGSDPVPTLQDLGAAALSGSAPLVLYLDPENRPDVLQAARELGATLAESGRRPPPEIAGLIARWIGLAGRRIEREGWSRPAPADPSRASTDWIEEVIAEAVRSAPAPGDAPGR